jgi:hypothetical protein
MIDVGFILLVALTGPVVRSGAAPTRPSRYCWCWRGLDGSCISALQVGQLAVSDHSTLVANAAITSSHDFEEREKRKIRKTSRNTCHLASSRG